MRIDTRARRIGTAALVAAVVVLAAAACGSGGGSPGKESVSTADRGSFALSAGEIDAPNIKVKDCPVSDIESTSSITATAGAGGGAHLIVQVTVTCKSSGKGIPGISVVVKLPGTGKTTPTKGGGAGGTDAVTLPPTDANGSASSEFDAASAPDKFDVRQAAFSVTSGFITVPLPVTVK